MAEHPYPCLVLAGPSGSGRRLIRKHLIEENPLFAVWSVYLLAFDFEAGRGGGGTLLSVETRPPFQGVQKLLGFF